MFSLWTKGVLSKMTRKADDVNCQEIMEEIAAISVEIDKSRETLYALEVRRSQLFDRFRNKFNSGAEMSPSLGRSSDTLDDTSEEEVKGPTQSKNEPHLPTSVEMVDDTEIRGDKEEVGENCTISELGNPGMMKGHVSSSSPSELDHNALNMVDEANPHDLHGEAGAGKSVGPNGRHLRLDAANLPGNGAPHTAQLQTDDDVLQPGVIYCYCRQLAEGKMLRCEADGCKYVWFHQGCLDMSNKARKKIEAADDDWICPECQRHGDLKTFVRRQKEAKEDKMKDKKKGTKKKNKKQAAPKTVGGMKVNV